MALYPAHSLPSSDPLSLGSPPPKKPLQLFPNLEQQPCLKHAFGPLLTISPHRIVHILGNLPLHARCTHMHTHTLRPIL